MTRGDTWSAGPSSPARADRITTREDGLVSTGITGGPACSDSRTARKLKSARSCSAASRAICMACSNRSNVTIGRLERRRSGRLALGVAQRAFAVAALVAGGGAVGGRS